MVLSQQIEVDLERLRHDADRHFTQLRESLHYLGTDTYAIRRLRQEVSRLSIPNPASIHKPHSTSNPANMDSRHIHSSNTCSVR